MRLFYALTFSPNSLDKISATQHKIAHAADKKHLVEADNFHITLEFIGEVSVSELPRYAALVGVLESELKHVLVTGLGSFGRGREKLLWLAVEKDHRLHSLHQQLKQQLNLIGFSGDTRQYLPHITIARHADLDCKLGQTLVFPHHLTLHSIALMESVRIEKRLTYRVHQEKLL